MHCVHSIVYTVVLQLNNSEHSLSQLRTVPCTVRSASAWSAGVMYEYDYET